MSKVARKPIQISEKIKLRVETNQVLVEGPLGKLEFSKNEGISVVQMTTQCRLKPKKMSLRRYREQQGRFYQIWYMA